MKQLTALITLSALLALPFGIASCSDKPKQTPTQTPPTAREITDKYVDTMVTAPQKARNAANATNEKNAAEEKLAKEADK